MESILKRVLALIAALSLVVIVGACGDDDDDDDDDMVDPAALFLGCWEGDMEIIAMDETMAQPVTFVITKGTTGLKVDSIDDDDTVDEMMTATISDGVATLAIPKDSDDANNPDCASWDASATLTPNASGNSITVVISGHLCGDVDTYPDGVTIDAGSGGTLSKVECK